MRPKRITVSQRRHHSQGDLASLFLPGSFSSFYHSSAGNDEEIDKYIRNVIKIWTCQSHPPDRVRKTILNMTQGVREVEADETIL
jgi:hypothetical protein